jgi:hypothetical protein
MEGANAHLDWKWSNVIVGGWKYIYEFKRAWFEWFEGKKVYLSWKGIHLSGLKVHMHIWEQEDLFERIEGSRVLWRMQIFIWMQAALTWIDWGTMAYFKA